MDACWYEYNPARRAFRLRKAPARNTVAEIIKNAAKIMKEEYGKGKRRKPLKVKAPDLEKRLEDWVARAERQGLCLNRKVITRKAQRLRYEVGGPALDVFLSSEDDTSAGARSNGSSRTSSYEALLLPQRARTLLLLVVVASILASTIYFDTVLDYGHSFQFK
ncbi:Homeodomain-like [Phytophthora cactorum]|nr:Homeodomain-like [Phytophthora cactorum]